MTLTLVSNYINHHQMPFCDALYDALGDGFTFVETMPMETERIQMGWADDCGGLPYVRRLYEEETFCHRLILESDVVILGWTMREDIDTERLESGRLTFRMSERIYREGRWKMISPRGLIHKYREHIRFRNSSACLLCAGAYVAGDFRLIRAYPDRMYRFGYFPPLRTYTEEEMRALKSTEEETVRLLYAGRMLELKRPGYCLKALRDCLDAGFKARLDMVGDGPLLDAMKEMAQQLRIADVVTFHGALPPEAVREKMERAQIFLFPSNHLEGWGAVVNEAMNSGCLVVASAEAGSVPYLLRDGINGLVFHNGSFTDFAEKVKYGMVHDDERLSMGRNAYRSILEEWNAPHAAKAFLKVADQMLQGERNVFIPGKGPMSKA